MNVMMLVMEKLPCVGVAYSLTYPHQVSNTLRGSFTEGKGPPLRVGVRNTGKVTEADPNALVEHTPMGYTQDMPLFEYACANCGRTDEHLVHVPAPERIPCSVCGAAARRLIPLLASSSGECSPAVSGGT